MRTESLRLLSHAVTAVVSTRALGARASPQVLLRWGLQRGTSQIPKATTAEHLAANLEVLAFELPEEDFHALNTLGYQARVLSVSAASQVAMHACMTGLLTRDYLRILYQGATAELLGNE